MESRKKIGIIAGAGLSAAAAVALRNRWSRGRAADEDADAGPGPAGAAFLEHLAEAVRIPTVSYEDRERVDRATFSEFRSFLERTYPAVHATLKREVVAGDSLLYTWEGSEPDAERFLLLAHQDVVPVEPGTEGEWPQPPFAGEIADGHLWGRGALDDKGSLIAILEAVEALVEEGFTPGPTVFLGLGHDEEVGGDSGAAAIADLLAERGVRLAFVLDEGGAVASDMMPGVALPLGLVGIGEKGYANVEIASRGKGGHSSAPPRESAIGALAAAVRAVEANPMPADLGPLRPFLTALGRAVGGLKGRILRNPDLFGRIIERQLSASQMTDALMRTTTAVTMISGGVKANVLCQEASAIVNFRLLPGDTSQQVLDRVRSVVGDGVSVRLLEGGFSTEASPMSSIESAAYGDIADTITDVFPDAAVVPWVLLGATDSRYFHGIAADVYRFAPFRVTPEVMSVIHGTGERVRVDDADDAVAFYRRLIVRAAGD
jgi:carboxypeptidase PM20D1